jgi:hypothetical protein
MASGKRCFFRSAPPTLGLTGCPELFLRLARTPNNFDNWQMQQQKLVSKLSSVSLQPIISLDFSPFDFIV